MKNKNRSFFQLLNRFFEPLFFDKKVTIKAISPAILNGFIWSMLLILIKDITNVIASNENGNLFFLTFLFIILSISYRVVIVVARNWTNVKIRPFWRQCFYKKYMKLYLNLDNNEIEKIGIWRLIAIVDKWFHTHIAQIVEITQDIIPNLIQTLVSIFFIFYLNIYYWLIVFISLILLWFIVYIQQKKADKLRKRRNELNISIMRNFIKILMSKFEVLSTNKWEYEIEKLTNSLNKNIEVNIKQTNITVRVDLWLRIFVDGIAFLMILLFGFWFLNQSINIWEFSSLIWIVYFLDKALSQMKSYYVNFLKNHVEIQKLRETFDKTKKMKDIEKWKTFIYKTWKISLKKISFSYDKNRVLNNFSLDIKGWTKTAFVGESWWWKTTLIKLLAWYIRPDEGEIRIDKQNLSDIKLADYYKHIGYLTQDPSVFDWTIHENLAYALDKEPTKKELEKVIQDSKCDFIREFKNWVETEIWERWVRLSWWQKQRLAIAKIMLKNPNIILLDEPTSALDSFNEEQVNIALHNLFKGKTVIVVAHRLQTVKQADRIIFIEQWKIIEEWTHQELVKLGGKYKKMLDLQSWF